MPIETPTAEELNKHEIEHDLIDLDEHIEDIAKKVAKEKVDEIPHFLGGGGGVGGGGGTGGLDTEAGDARYLKLDQTTPQTITGIPIFKNGPPTTITRNASGFITKKEWSNGYYVEYTRDVNNIITSCTDGTNIWTPTYSSGFITSVTVTTVT